MEDSILTVDQVAQIIQVHPFTVLKFIKQGKLKAAKLGRVYRIRRIDVDAFIDGQVELSEKKSPTASPKKSKKSIAQIPSVKEASGDSLLTAEPKEVAMKEEIKKVEPMKTVPVEPKTVEPKKDPTESIINNRTQSDSDHYIIKVNF